MSENTNQISHSSTDEGFKDKIKRLFRPENVLNLMGFATIILLLVLVAVKYNGTGWANSNVQFDLIDLIVFWGLLIFVLANDSFLNRREKEMTNNYLDLKTRFFKLEETVRNLEDNKNSENEKKESFKNSENE